MHNPIHVVLADDHPLVRAGVRLSIQAAPDIDVIGEASNGEEAQRLCEALSPDVLVLDLQMPGPSSIETVTHLRTHVPTLKVIVLTAYDDEAYVRPMLAAGVAGYVIKEEATETVVRAIRAVAQGDRWLSPVVIATLTAQPAEPATDPVASLTERERQILQLIALGRDNVRIAQELSLAEQTVRNYISRIYAAIGVRTRAEAIIWARDRHLA